MPAQMVAALGDGGVSALRLGLDCAARVEHDFNAAALCLVPVTLHVRNCSADTWFAFSFRLASAEDEDGSTTDKDVCVGGGHFAWTGNTGLQLQWIGPGELALLRLSATMRKEGVYVLGGLQVSLEAARVADEGATELRPMANPSTLQPILCPSPTKPVTICAPRAGT